jgi:hypothetical protein
MLLEICITPPPPSHVSAATRATTSSIRAPSPILQPVRRNQILAVLAAALGQIAVARLRGEVD